MMNNKFGNGNNNCFFDSNQPSMPCRQLHILNFYNDDTLNIFTDASEGKTDKSRQCYGAICVVKDTIIDFAYFPVTNYTINACEINGIKIALSFAFKYINNFKSINIFSDSLISVNGLTDYIYGWKCKDNVLYTTSGKVVANQSIFIESFELYKQLLLLNPNIKIWHLSGHVNVNKNNSIIDAANKFVRFNNYNGSVDLNFIRYISKYNDIIDHRTRDFLDNTNYNITSPISFYATHSY